MKLIDKILFVKLLVFFCMLTAFGIVYANHAGKSYAQGVSLGIYPPIYQIELTPPTSVSQPIKIQNNSSEPIALEISYKLFTTASSDNGQIKYLPDSESLHTADPKIFQKIQILDNNQSVDQINLAPGEEKDLTMAIQLPAQEPPFDYYFTVLFISKAQQMNQKNASLSAAGIGMNVLLSIGPKDKTNGFINEFSVPFYLDHGPVQFRLSIANASKHFIVPKGIIVIKNMFGQIVGKVELLPVNILSQTTRFIPDKSYTLSDTALWPESLLVGPYTAHLTVALSPDGPLYNKTIFFLAVPYQLLILFIIVCVVISLIILRIRYKLRT